jgi:outer membrane receptor protein involved in Fe transport
VTEIVDTRFHSLFARSQARLDLPRGLHLLGGVEYTGILYRGDDRHQANVDLTDPAGEFAQLDEFRTYGPVYEPILDRPVHRIGSYVQAVSGQLLGDAAELTAGARYDTLHFHYDEVDEPARSSREGSFHQLSPRVGLVVRPHRSLRLKAMAGRSFRTPTIIELFLSNSWSGATDPEALEPESSRTYELAVDWAPASWARLRANVLHVDQKNTIDFDNATGLLRNILSNRRGGGEVEALVERRVGPMEVSGFASYSYARLLDEEVLDPALTPSSSLVWSPGHMLKGGLRANDSWYGGSLSGTWQGMVRRRSSDRMDPLFRTLRPPSVPAWLAINASLFVRPRGGIKVGLEGWNLLGSSGHLVAPNDHSFDYPIAPREILGVVELDL